MSVSETPVPLVIGHRGSPTKAMENTLESFDWAEADGADGIELDVRLTSDGESVVHHDADVESPARTAIANLTLVELLALEISKGPFSGRVPALRDVFSRFCGDWLYFVELKAGPSPRHGLMEHCVVSLIQRFALLQKARVLSFAPDILRRIHEYEPRLETVLVYDGTTFRSEGTFWPELPKGCRGIGPHFSLVTTELVVAARAAGLGIHTWTVNDPDKAKTLAASGVSSIISDVPGEIARALKPSKFFPGVPLYGPRDATTMHRGRWVAG